MVMGMKKWNKRAQADSTGDDIGAEGPSAIIYIPAVLIVFIIFFYITLQFIEIENVYSPRVRSYIESQKFFSNPDCLAYVDQVTGRVYPYTISLEQFSQNTLNNCFEYKKENSAFRISLYDATEHQNQIKSSIKTGNWKNSKDSYSQKFSVRIESAGHFSQGVIKLETQT